MKRVFRSSSAPSGDGDSGFAGVWHCQVIRTEIVGEVLTLDLVALEPFPADHLECPAYTPFTLVIGAGTAPDPAPDVERPPETIEAMVSRWAASDQDIVRIRSGSTASASWLCLSVGADHLVVELRAPPAG